MGVLKAFRVEVFLRLILACLKVGAFTVGGAAAIFPVLAHEWVRQNGWLSRQEFLYAFSLGEATPGPAVIGTVIAGIKWAGIGGGVLILTALIAPGLLWMKLACRLRHAHQSSVWADRFLKGVSAAVPGLLVGLSLKLIPSDHPIGPGILAIGTTLLLIIRWGVHPALLILGAVAISWIAG